MPKSNFKISIVVQFEKIETTFNSIKTKNRKIASLLNVINFYHDFFKDQKMAFPTFSLECSVSIFFFHFEKSVL